MAELDFDYRVFDQVSVNGPQPGDEKLFVKFYPYYTENVEKTIEEGRPVYDDCDFIRIVTPGDRNNIVDRPVRASDKFRFAKQYEHYKQHGAQALTGTVLEEWPMISRAMVENLKTVGFHTVEQLAEARDDIVQRFPGMTMLKQKAQNYLDLAKGAAPVAKLESALAEAVNQNEVLARQVKELSSKVEELSKKK
jgi:hypothetical protein